MSSDSEFTIAICKSPFELHFKSQIDEFVLGGVGIGSVRLEN